MSAGENFRLAVATRGFRGGGLGTRYVAQEFVVEENHEVVNINTIVESISVNAIVDEIAVYSVEVEIA